MDRSRDDEAGVGEPAIRLVLADDRAQSRSALRALLATWPGVVVVGEAADGREALRLVQECSPDAVLMDIRMPGMDGLEAARAIKAEWPRIRIVLLTMYASYQDEAFAAGADTFLIKGCSTDELLDAIVSPRPHL